MITIIGIDCATLAQNTGIARGIWDGTAVSLEAIALGKKNEPLAQTVAGWLPDDRPVLMALDAPLGWPTPLGKALATHQAGEPLDGPANSLFRRETDRLTWQRTGKLPLDVGADRIARTAHSALKLLADLQDITGNAVPLAWEIPLQAKISAIEVYPAGTLKMMFAPQKTPRYKGKNGGNGRREIIKVLARQMTLPNEVNLLHQNDDALDAALAVLAGADFLQGCAKPPSDLNLAQKEGWIWVRQ